MLYELKDLQSRAANGENQRGEKGRGGMARGGRKGCPSIAPVRAGKTYTLLDADKIYAELLPSQMPSLKEAFGPEIENPDGTLNRPLLAKTVFGDESARQKLNALTHPAVLDEIGKRILTGTAKRVLVEAIALIESGFSRLCDVTVAIWSTREQSRARICLRDNLSPEDADRRLNAQKEPSFYREHTDYGIQNDDLDKLKQVTETLLKLWEEIQ